MTEINTYEYILTPALYDCKASGREKNNCLVCNQKLEKGEKIVKLFSSSYKGNHSYTNRFHNKCFLKVLAIKFPELLDENFKESIIKEVCIEKIK